MKISKIKAINKGSLICAFELEHSGLVVDMTLMKGQAGHWVGYPSRAYKNAQGEDKSWAQVRWTDKDLAERAKDWIINELARLDPSLFKQEKIEPSQEELDNLPF